MTMTDTTKIPQSPDGRAWSSPRSAAAAWGAYVLLLVGAVALFHGVQYVGAGLSTTAAAVKASVTPHEAAAAVLPKLLGVLALVALTTRVVATVLERFMGQPPVVGEIVAGIALGPSCFGAIAPEWSRFLLPAPVVGHLGMLSTLGIVLFMFLVGLELDAKILRANARATLSIAHASILVPFSLGGLLSLFLYSRYSTEGTDFTVFAMFIGVSLSVTAFPVLARILEHRSMQGTSLGVTAIGCAAVDDATAWCLLAFVSGLARAKLGDAFWTAISTVSFVAVLLLLRPALRRLAEGVEHSDSHSGLPLALVLVGVLISATATELIGIHALFGAFAFGACLPAHGRLAERARASLHELVLVLLLPIFFAFTGLRTQIALVNSVEDLLMCAVIILIASLGKFGGTYLAARYQGTPARDAVALGVLMNTRGLMELIVLNVGLDLGVLPPKLFTMLVLMALVTTFATSPVLGWLKVGRTSALPA